MKPLTQLWALAWALAVAHVFTDPAAPVAAQGGADEGLLNGASEVAADKTRPNEPNKTYSGNCGEGKSH